MRQIGGVFFSKGEILIEMIKNVKIVIIWAFKSKFYQYFSLLIIIIHWKNNILMDNLAKANVQLWR